MFFNSITGLVTEFTADTQTRFQCTVRLSVPPDMLPQIEFGTLIAAENTFFTQKEKRYTILTILNALPDFSSTKTAKSKDMTLVCQACPIGMELQVPAGKDEGEIAFADTYPTIDAGVSVLDDTTTASVLHQIAPDSRTRENGSRIDIGTYATNPKVKVGLDASTLLRGNSAIISSRPRARTTITTDLIIALLSNPAYPVHVVYCDVNNQNSLSLTSLLANSDTASILCLNDKFVPPSVFSALRSQNDRQVMKRAAFDYLDMMILPSVLEHRRQEFTFAIHGLLRANKISIYRPNEQTVDQFINDIRIDILDGIEEDIESYVNGLMNGIAETYQGERFGEKNTKDILEMIDEFGVDSKNHSARRTLYDLRAEVQSVYETYSKDVPSTSRKTIPDVINELNDETRSSLIIMQGQKTTDMLRFIGTLTQTLVDDRLKRLKVRVPVLFIFNNADEYVQRSGAMGREGGSERFQDIVNAILNSGRRHGLSFCMTMENGGMLDKPLARKIQSYFIGPIGYGEDTETVARLLNVSEQLVRPAVNFDDGDLMFSSADSPYHRRVPLRLRTQKNTDIIHSFLDVLSVEQERRRKEFNAIEDDRSKRLPEEKKPLLPREQPGKSGSDRHGRRQEHQQQRSNEQQKRQADTPPRVIEIPSRPAASPIESSRPVIIPTVTAATPVQGEDRPAGAPTERLPLRFEFKPADVVARAAAEQSQAATAEKPVEAPSPEPAGGIDAPAPQAATEHTSRRHRGRKDKHGAKATGAETADMMGAEQIAASPVPAKSHAVPAAPLPIETLTFEPRKAEESARAAKPVVDPPMEHASPASIESPAPQEDGAPKEAAKPAKKAKAPARKPRAAGAKKSPKKPADEE